ncbi:MAG: LamG domain-containing protein [Myxococcales bacterium]|nr:LamG domain-containing protein [Myxococcales bacterium]
MVSPPDIPSGITTNRHLPTVGDPGIPNVSRRDREVDPTRDFLLDISAGGGMVVDLAQLPGMSTYSVEMWVNFARDVDQTIVASRDFKLELRSQRLRVEIGKYEIRGRAVRPNAWYHVAVVVEGQRARLYINGSLVTRASLPAVTDDAIGAAFVVAPAPRGREYAFAGRIDNLRVISTALTQQNSFVANGTLSKADGVVFAFSFDGGEAPGERVTPSSGSYSGRLVPGALVVPGAP